MDENIKYYVVKQKALPEVLLKVAQANRLIETKGISVADATEQVGISRSSYYKYKEDIFPFRDNVKGKTITFVLSMDDEPGLLSLVLKKVAEFHANILTIHQTIPVNGVASLTLSVDILPSTGDSSKMIEEIEQLPGVRYLKILSREKIYYIRKLSSTIEATDTDVKELMSLSHNIPFDDRINPKAEMKDLKYPIIKNYLQNVDSSLLNDIDTMDTEQLARNLRIADGPSEYYKPLNVGILFFNDHPESFFPYSQIEVVNIPDPTGQGMEERIFTGPIDDQLRNALNYIKNNVIAEKVFKISGQAEAVRVKNYSYEAIEEFLSNAIYHKSYQIHEPVTVRIEADKIEITSSPGPDRSISDEDISKYQMRTRRYRNRRIGDFLKELHLVEGRNTGIPTAIKSIKENGSPLPLLLTDEERSFFSVIIPIHEAFLKKEAVSSKTEPKDIVAVPKRRTKDQIKTLILNELEQESISANELYKRLGYSGNASKTFRKCIEELITENKVHYASDNMQDGNNVLVKG